MRGKLHKLKNNLSFNKLFGNNKFVLVLSLLIAIVLWVSFVLNSKTETTRVFNDVPVKIDTSGMLSYLRVTDGEDQKVSVRLSGSKLALNSVKKDDISLTAQIGAGYVTGSGTFPFNITGSVSSQNVRIASINPQSIQISFDSFTSVTLPVEIDDDSISAQDGYIKNTTFSNLDRVVVSGPSLALKRIAYAQAAIEQTEMLNQTRAYSVDIKLYTEQRNEIDIDAEGLELNARSVSLTVPILKRHSIPLSVDFTNQPTEYRNNPIEYTMVPRSIEVATPVNFEVIDSINVGTVDFREIEPGAYFEYDIELPSEYVSIDNVKKVTVTPSTYGLGSTLLDVTEFTANGVPSSRSLDILTTRLSNVEIIGPESILSRITSNDVFAEVQWSDISSLNGETVIPVKIKVRNYSDCWAFGKYEVNAKIK
ncbi:MAG: hypothetical protein IKS19_06435 [Clostridia bacterium]|nr:hypothetical protein [Clostridia bacterium]